ncbi:proline--tRNA ligase [bacterium]|nr:proline--tRNA ligase [bacterium]
MSQEKTAIQPTRQEDYSEWYQQVIKAADLAEPSPVRGCMVIKPWGYALWENVQKSLDGLFKETGHVNAYFPLFIPLRFMEKEAEHVEGFAKECAVVTHHRLEDDGKGGLKPAGELEEPLVIRPTSETIIGEMYAKWVQSYRDLPVLINQWANVVRWEMRTRLFLRTTEFLWQEGHTAHETRDEAWDETMKMLDVYRVFAEEYMAVPVITGEKTAGERFPGAENTFCIEAMMQDRKALQSGTSHFLGQNFAKAAQIQYQSREGQLEYAWTTSWGVSTRLIGAMIMAHGDDNGMVIPPRLAPSHVVILPILRSESDGAEVLPFCESLASDLRKQTFRDRNVDVVIDRRDMNAGEKSWQWVKKGIPVTVEIGPRDIGNNTVFVGRRDKGRKERISLNRDEFVRSVPDILEDMQKGLYERALAFRNTHMHEIRDWKAFSEFYTPENQEKPGIHGGFVRAFWCGDTDCENRINEQLSVTIRCIPFDQAAGKKGSCVACGKESGTEVVFAKAY